MVGRQDTKREIPVVKPLQRIAAFVLAVSLAASGSASAAAGDAAPSRSDLAEYVYLHETRSQGVPLQIAARATMCRGTPVAARN